LAGKCLCVEGKCPSGFETGVRAEKFRERQYFFSRREEMKNFLTAALIPICLAVAGLLALLFVFGGDSSQGLTERLPGFDGTPEQMMLEGARAAVSGQLVTFDGVASKLSGSWPCFRGADFDNISRSDVGLAGDWAADGPAVLWSVDLGEGYAGPAVLNGRVYVVDYDMQVKADAVRCFSFDDGAEIWRYSYPVKIKRNHGMSRTVPAVNENFLVAMGPKCYVTCLDSQSGDYLWSIDLVNEYGTKVPLWYAGQCPVIEEGRAILAPAGEALMIAVDCETGQIVWESENPNDWEMTHSSIMPMDFAGEHFYVYCGGGGVAGVSADDGRILWQTDAWKMRTNVPSPVVVGGGLIFLSAGYNQGCLMLQLNETNGQITAETIFRLEADVFGADQQTPIFYNGFIYGVRPDEQMVCLDVQGNVIWTSGPESKFGYGPFMIADDLMFIMNDEGLLTLAQVSADGYEQLGQWKVLTGHESWGPMAIASGRLIVRDFTTMVCLDVAQY
jgi:outer membrane protein assembly factor BamB